MIELMVHTDLPAARTRREQILDEARVLFIAHGVEAVTTRQIARAVGISQPSLYAHFPTRHAIADELCGRAFDRLHARLTTVSLADGTPRERLHRLGREYIEFGLSDEAAYRIAFMLELPPEISPMDSSALAAGLRAFGVLLDLFERVHGRSGPDIDAAAQSTWASMHGLVALLLTRPEFPWADRKKLIELHLSHMCASVLEQ